MASGSSDHHVLCNPCPLYVMLQQAMVFTIYKLFPKKSCWRVNKKLLFVSFRWKIPGSYGSPEKVVLFSLSDCFKPNRVRFLQSHLWYQFRTFVPIFSLNGTPFVPVVNAIPGRNLSVLNFSYHFPKPLIDRFAHVNDNYKQPIPSVFSQFFFFSLSCSPGYLSKNDITLSTSVTCMCATLKAFFL